MSSFTACRAVCVDEGLAGAGRVWKGATGWWRETCATGLSCGGSVGCTEDAGRALASGIGILWVSGCGVIAGVRASVGGVVAGARASVVVPSAEPVCVVVFVVCVFGVWLIEVCPVCKWL